METTQAAHPVDLHPPRVVREETVALDRHLACQASDPVEAVEALVAEALVGQDLETVPLAKSA
jgi:hypothetical protein